MILVRWWRRLREPYWGRVARIHVEDVRAGRFEYFRPLVNKTKEDTT